MNVSSQNSNEIYHQYQNIKNETVGKYVRDIAAELALSEAELTWCRVGHDAWRLLGNAGEILTALEAVGETKCICRNEYAVHEQQGAFTNLSLGEHSGLVLNPRALDLRLFVSQWICAFHLNGATVRGERQSIQFFDNQGDAVLKVYTTERTDMAEWGNVLSRFIFTDNPPLLLSPAQAVTETLDVNAQNLDHAWRQMTDVHQFFRLLKQHNISRQQAFRLVGDDLACQVDNRALGRLFEKAHQDGNEIMIFVGNRGCVQIFTGSLQKVARMHNWLNVFNATFTLHLREDDIAESWITRKPTADGFVTSLELFAEDGTQIAQIYGQRSEGQPEQTRWREQINSLTGEDVAA